MDNDISMHNFLVSVKNNLKSDKPKWLVIGNEAGDLDSVICSLTYSYYKHINFESFQFIPIVSIPKKNINLRNDVIAWLKVFQVDAFKELIFLEEIMPLLGDEQFCIDLKITLVDHHKPIKPTLMKYVKEVIDHHTIAFEYPSGQLELFNVQTVGSCSTLIASYILNEQNLLNRNILLKLVYGPILLDTDCLLPKNDRTTDLDINIVCQIENCLAFNDEYRSNIYQTLASAKSDLSGLSLSEKVQRDLKIIEVEWRNLRIKIALPTLIATDVQEIIKIDGIENELHSILDELQTNALIILTCGHQTIKRRGYVIFVENPDLMNEICKFFASKLQLEPIDSNHHSNIRIFVENHFMTTRKIFIPLIEIYFAQESQMTGKSKHQSNNCNINQLHLHELEGNIEVDDGEREGAPYTLSTPRCSFSCSPDIRSSDINLRSLNNRHTIELVGKKRQKLSAEFESDEDYHEDNDIKPIEGDVSPLAFTPENSGEENNDSNDDDIGPLPSINKKTTVDTIQPKYVMISDNIDTNLSPSKSPKSPSLYSWKTGLSQSEASKTIKAEDVAKWNQKLNYLENEVDKKRQKLETNRFDAIANIIVSDIITKSEMNFQNEIVYKEILQKWSNSYSESEKLEFIKNIDADDTSKFVKLLTTGIIRDCISEFELVSIEPNDNKPIAKDIDEIDEGQSADDESSDSDNMSAENNSTIPDLEINYNSCPIGTIINKDNPCVTASGLDVENSSFNLYRRISTNQLDFSEDEKRLFIIANSWCPDDDIIYSDSEKEPDQAEDNEEDADVVRKVVFPSKDITMNIKL